MSPLLLVLLAGLGLWLWLGKNWKARLRKIPAAWLGIGGTLAGAVLVAKGQPVIGALVATGSGLWLRYGASLLPGAAASTSTSTLPARPERDRADAAELLGVRPDADRDEILAAYRKLMARNHPDAGGSAGLAARINAARDLLLK